MRQHLYKKYQKLTCVLLLGIAIVLNGCQKDDVVDKARQTPETAMPTITTLSLDEVDETFDRLKNDLGIERYLKQNRELDMHYRTTMDTLGLTIITDIIKQVTQGNYTSYTMQILKETDTTVFYNLTIEYKDGTSGMFATKYMPTDYWLANQEEPYQGYILTRKIKNTRAVF